MVYTARSSDFSQAQQYYVILLSNVLYSNFSALRNMLEASPQRRSRPAAATMPSVGNEHKVRLSLLPSTGTSTLTASKQQAVDVERGYSNATGDVIGGASAAAAGVPIGTTILVQQNEAPPAVLSKYQVGKNHFP